MGRKYQVVDEEDVVQHPHPGYLLLRGHCVPETKPARHFIHVNAPDLNLTTRHIYPILQMKKTGFLEINDLVHGHTALEKLNQN